MVISRLKVHMTHRKSSIYSLVIKETHLDVYGHVNNATYLTLFEEARWEWVTKNGYGFQKIKETGLGPVILEINMRFLKELRLREKIKIETKTVSYKRKIGKLVQTMKRGKEICCIAEFLIGLFDLNERTLVLPTPDWLAAIGLEGPS